jgi:hypothetical protein
MEHLLPYAAALACPVAMGAMMLMMMRHNGGPDGRGPREIEQLRAEIDRLRQDRADDTGAPRLSEPAWRVGRPQ